MTFNSDIEITMPYIIGSVVFSFYKTILSITWTPVRYRAYVNSVKISLVAAQNRNPYIILNSLRLIQTYMTKMYKDKLELESEYCIFVAAFRIGQKFNDDFHCHQLEIDLNMLTEMSSVQLKQFEFRFLERINYDISMSKEEYYEWRDHCQNIYVASITPTIIDNDNNYYQETSFIELLNSNIDYSLYNDNCDGIAGLPSPPSSVISKNEPFFQENQRFINFITDFQYEYQMN